MQRFWFQVEQLEPNRQYRQRTSADGRWLPPRQRGSNTIRSGHTTGHWYYHDGNHTTRVRQPAQAQYEEFKTFSFYHDHGYIWVYPDDAESHAVGNGTGHSDDGDTDNDSGSSSGDEDEEDRHVEDWQPLSFDWPLRRDVSHTSYATVRGGHELLYVQRQDQSWVRQVMPSIYWAAPEYRDVPAGHGGLVGELPILIALIAFSVPPSLVDAAVRTSIYRQQYRQHRLCARGEGCKHLRINH